MEGERMKGETGVRMNDGEAGKDVKQRKRMEERVKGGARYLRRGKTGRR